MGSFVDSFIGFRNSATTIDPPCLSASDPPRWRRVEVGRSVLVCRHVPTQTPK